MLAHGHPHQAPQRCIQQRPLLTSIASPLLHEQRNFSVGDNGNDARQQTVDTVSCPKGCRRACRPTRAPPHPRGAQGNTKRDVTDAPAAARARAITSATDAP